MGDSVEAEKRPCCTAQCSRESPAMSSTKTGQRKLSTMVPTGLLGSTDLHVLSVAF